MNFTRPVEVDKVICKYCDQQFYEFKDYEVEKCPHCKSNLSGEGFCDVVETLTIELKVDYTTGRIKLLQ